jgi:hypothetical protein
MPSSLMPFSTPKSGIKEQIRGNECVDRNGEPVHNNDELKVKMALQSKYTKFDIIRDFVFCF